MDQEVKKAYKQYEKDDDFQKFLRAIQMRYYDLKDLEVLDGK